MSQGLQIYDATGALVMDSNSRLSTYHARYTLAGGTATSLYQPIPGFTLDGTWAVYCSEFYVHVIPEEGGVAIRGARDYRHGYQRIGTVFLYIFRV